MSAWGGSPCTASLARSGGSPNAPGNDASPGRACAQQLTGGAAPVSGKEKAAGGGGQPSPRSFFACTLCPGSSLLCTPGCQPNLLHLLALAMPAQPPWAGGGGPAAPTGRQHPVRGDCGRLWKLGRTRCSAQAPPPGGQGRAEQGRAGLPAARKAAEAAPHCPPQAGHQGARASQQASSAPRTAVQGSQQRPETHPASPGAAQPGLLLLALGGACRRRACTTPPTPVPGAPKAGPCRGAP